MEKRAIIFGTEFRKYTTGSRGKSARSRGWERAFFKGGRDMLSKDNKDLEKEREQLIKLYTSQYHNIVKPVEDSIKSFEASIPSASFSIQTDIRG